MAILTTSMALSFGIREKRRELGLTQQELANRVGVARQWVVKIESGKTRIDLEALLRTLVLLELELHLDDAPPAGDLDDYVQSFVSGDFA
ncbi:helix-turn-helix transcriptional regulator [Salinibacterium sp. SWN248]|uniref:helix-turn-helix transcriptional regulator n=1 Tax=Salinibacterium sp. SWN248 TaxID=2792056 RepID=UPI0018CD83A9|nr:helix-turn-helix transcriptional regulator [Salinibacterium sp. SWN248]MBH0023040.1 helix-turn-helix transcriptional regulator [Salinibacterium sp. SWN248]